MRVLKTDDMKVPLKIWAEKLEESCIDQMKTVCSLPFLHSHVSLMPDAHFGYGTSIGSVIATKGVVLPSLVGVDIGCGMGFSRYNIDVKDITIDQIKDIMGIIRKNVPVGFNHNDKPLAIPYMHGELYICKQEKKNAELSVGTLGGGNHFIELQKTSDGKLGVMVHSGSRNLGKKVADHYNALAKEINTEYYSVVDPSLDLAFLPIDSVEGKNYINEMNYCVEFALANRREMLLQISLAINNVLNVEQTSFINIAHNYAAMENHFGKNVMVHRKGATKATTGELGLIPGSQGTKSYVVSGLGNKDSFNSCSHGAGRAMGRKDAQRSLNLEDEIKRLDDQGIVHGIRTVKDLDEAAGAYKDIDVVMEEQKDLVYIVDELTPLAVIKG